jgi:hypothetical protein
MGKKIRENNREPVGDFEVHTLWGWGLLLLILFGFSFITQTINEKGNPPSYQLTEEDNAAGFERSCFDRRYSCDFDNALWRLMGENEYGAHPECDLETSWCVVVKPMANNCNQIVVDGETRQTDGLFGQKIRDVSATLDADAGELFKAGEPVNVSVQARGFLSKFLHVTRASCQLVNE